MTNAFSRRSMREFLVPDAGQKPAKSPTSDDPSTDNPPKKSEAESALPDKYKGKSLEEVIEMHQNSEKRLGQIQNELGITRGLVSDLASIQRAAPAPKTEEQDEIELTGDDIINDPVGSVRKVVTAENRKAELTRQEADLQSRVQAETSALYNDYPELEDTINDPDFLEWAKKRQSRIADFQLAATGEGLEQVSAARRLLDNYADFKEAATPAEEPEKPSPTERARKVANEGGDSRQKTSTGEVFYQDDVVELIRTNPAKWRSPSFQKEFQTAVKEGRYVSN